MFLYFMWDNENIFLAVGLALCDDDGALALWVRLCTVAETNCERTEFPLLSAAL